MNQLTLNLNMEEASQGKAINNQKCLEQFEKFNGVGLWAKTFANLLVNQDGWFSMNCKLIWKLRATKSHRFYFQLFPSTIEDLLPTPTTQESTSECEVNENGRRVTTGISYTLNIGRMASMGMLPTPTTMTGGAVKVTAMKKDNTFSASLHDLAKSGMLPTPTAFDWNSARTEKKWEEDKAKWAEKGVNLQMPLKQMARLKLLPTPKAVEAPSASWDKRNPNSKYKPGVTLTDLNVWGMLPTPTVSDHNAGRRGNAPRKNHNPTTNSLKDAVNFIEETVKSSHLNPEFVLEMMGFPTDWTLVPFLKKEICN
jgi:hypothetical protein